MQNLCVHIHPIMIKIPPVFFFLIPILKSPFSDLRMNSSRHLLPTSESLKRQRINVTFVLKGMCLLICLNTSMFVQIFCDSASSTEE